MSRHQRLKLARKKHFATAKEAASSLGVPYGTYSGHEAGTRGFKEDEVKLYARRFKVSPEWLYFGLRKVDGFGKYEVDIIGSLFSSEGAVQIDKGVFVAILPFPVPETALAIQITENYLWPRYGYGDLIIYDESLSEFDDDVFIYNSEVVIEDTSSRMFVTFIERGQTEGMIRRKTHMAMRSDEIQCAGFSAIVAVVRRGGYEIVYGEDVVVPAESEAT